MLSHSALLNLRLGDLKTAVDDWSAVVTKLQELNKSARSMDARSKKATWSGINSEVTKPFVSKTAGEFNDAAVQATSIRNILRDAHIRLSALKKKLQTSVEDAANDNLTVLADGTVSMLVHPDRAASDSAASGTEKTKADALKTTISKILEEARDVDAIASRALKTIEGENPYDFSGINYSGLSEADKAQAIIDANVAVQLASQGAELTEREMNKLSTLLRENASDQKFGSHFYRQLGPEAALRFNTELATYNFSAKPGAQWKAAKEVQDELGRTLATATRAIGEPGYLDESWVNDLKKFGRKRVYLGGSKRASAAPYGYQSLATLLDEGVYGTEFLNEVSQDMIKMDRRLKGKWPWNSYGDWHLDLTRDAKNYDVNEVDPVTYLLEANSKNPEAAQQLFKDGENITYLLESQENYKGRGDSLGHALESAVMGIRYDTTQPLQVPHSDAQIQIMKDVMKQVSLNDELVTTEIGDSLGHMAAAYMPEIHRTTVGHGAEEVFPLPDKSSDKELDRADTLRFLYNLAQEPDANAAVTLGRNVYTSSLIEAHIADPGIYSGSTKEAIGTVSEAAGMIESVMAHSRQDIELENKDDAIEKDEKAMERQGDWIKGFAGAAIGVTAIALTPATGGTSAAVAAAAGTPFFTTVAEQIVDLMYDDRVDDDKDEVLYRSGREILHYQDSITRSIQMASEFSNEYHNTNMDLPSLNNYIRQQIQNGWTGSDQILEDVIERPSR